MAGKMFWGCCATIWAGMLYLALDKFGWPGFGSLVAISIIAAGVLILNETPRQSQQ